VGGSLAFDAVWLFGAFILILVLAAAFLATRRYLLERGGGTVECGLRKPGGSWRLGVAQYGQEELHWFSAFGISARPEEILPRRDLTIVNRRRAEQGEESILGSGRIIVTFSLPGNSSVELALADSALTGLLSWLEAAPPGSQMGWASLRCYRIVLPVPAWLPQHVAEILVGHPAEDEQQVGHPVQVLGRQRVHRVPMLIDGGPRRPLRAPRDGPRRVQQRGARRPAGEDERAEHL
jgi:hypothetical protein